MIDYPDRFANCEYLATVLIYIRVFCHCILRPVRRRLYELSSPSSFRPTDEV